MLTHHYYVNRINIIKKLKFKHLYILIIIVSILTDIMDDTELRYRYPIQTDDQSFISIDFSDDVMDIPPNNKKLLFYISIIIICIIGSLIIISY